MKETRWSRIYKSLIPIGSSAGLTSFIVINDPPIFIRVVMGLMALYIVVYYSYEELR